MQPVKHELVKAKRLTLGKGNYFFGYYDIVAWNEKRTCHLCHKVDFWRRMPEKDNKARLVDKDFFKSDGHCSFSPGKNYILYNYMIKDKGNLFIFNPVQYFNLWI